MLDLVRRAQAAAVRRRSEFRSGASAGGEVPHSAWSVLQAADQAVCVADMRAADQPLVFVNDAFTAVTGYDAAEVVGSNCRFLHRGLDQPTAQAELAAFGSDPAEVEEALQRIRALIRGGDAGRVELVNRRRDGQLFLNELSLSPLRTGSGTVTHYVAVQRDITFLHDSQRARDALSRDLDQTATALQAALVPARLPELARFALTSGYQPATRGDGSRGAVSGDFYDVFAGPDGANGDWFAVLGDVSGRGPAAAATTGALRWALRGAGTAERTAAGLLRAAGHAVHEGLDERFATVAACRLPAPRLPVGPKEAYSGRVHVALAGHPRPVLLPAAGVPRFVGEPGTLLGPFGELEVNDTAVDLAPGDHLVLYTDGVTEAFDPLGRELDDDGLLRVLASVPERARTGADAGEVVRAHILQAVDAHVAGGPVDDLTLLIITRRS